MDPRKGGTLPETNIAPTNGWLEDDPFLLGRPIFRDYVSFRESRWYIYSNFCWVLLESHQAELHLRNQRITLQSLVHKMGYLCDAKNGNWNPKTRKEISVFVAFLGPTSLEIWEFSWWDLRRKENIIWETLQIPSSNLDILQVYWCVFLIHPRKLTWNLKITCLKRKIIFQTSIFGFHVSFRGCSLLN